MQEWFEQMVGPDYASAVMWTVLALVLLFAVLLVIRVVRGIKGGTFVMGGRNRKTRLAVMDATAVDANRRLVLVRRDDVEHLILIGGPTDVVVEQNIRLGSVSRRPEPPLAETTAPAASEPIEVPPPRPAPPPVRPAPMRADEPVAPRPAPPVAQRPDPAPRPPVAQPYPAAQPSPAAPAVAAPAPMQRVNPQMSDPRAEPRMSPSAAPMPAQPFETPQPRSPIGTAEPGPLVSAYKVQRGTADNGWVLQHAHSDAEILPPEPRRQPATQPVTQTPTTQTTTPPGEFDIDEKSLEEEMNRLLGDLSNPSR